MVLTESQASCSNFVAIIAQLIFHTEIVYIRFCLDLILPVSVIQLNRRRPFVTRPFEQNRFVAKLVVAKLL